MSFKTARLDTIAVIISTLVTVFIAALAIFFILNVPSGWIWAIAMMLIPAGAFLRGPKRYVFDHVTCTIEKRIGKNIVIPLKAITGYKLIDDLTHLKMTRTFGNGGLFGYYGMFSTTTYGPINFQLTNMKHVVLIETDAMMYAISPSRYEQFLHMLTSRIEIQPGSVHPSVKKHGHQTSPIILILPVFLYAATIIAVYLAYRILPDTIAVHFDAFGTPDRWGSKISYLINGIIPASILCMLAIGIFYLMRRTTKNPALPVFIVVIISVLQLFTFLININTYWLNQHNQHMIPFIPVVILFSGILVLLLFVYYRIVKKTKR